MLPRLHDRLRKGEKAAIAVFGDSVGRGDDAATPSLGYVSLWADRLHERHGSQILVTNLSQGGATIVDAYRMLELLKAPAAYDLFLLAVGLNDAGCRLKPKTFAHTLDRIRKAARNAGADLLVVTPLEPVPGYGDVGPYCEILRASGLPLADVNAVWDGRGYANGINHPDEEGHRLYEGVLDAAAGHLSRPTVVLQTSST